MIGAINQWAYVSAAYAIVFGTLLLYVARTVALGRRVGRRLPPEERRWM